MAKSMRFSDIRIGDYVFFTKTFSARDFDAFSRFSGDRNPLHCKKPYAVKSGYKRTVVPVHMTAAPLSAIAGMAFPGEASLYLSHELRAMNPVYYRESICYSGKVISINAAQRILTIRTIGFRSESGEIVIVAEMRVQARTETWSVIEHQNMHIGRDNKTALITGAGGEIGRAVAEHLAMAGWNLLLHHRGPASDIKSIVSSCRSCGVKVATIKADLLTANGRSRVCSAIAENSDISAIIHTACPQIEDNLDSHVTVSYLVLREMIEAATTGFLQRQNGKIVSLGSTAMEKPPTNWENYAAGKTLAVNLLNTFSSRFSQYNINGVILAPGFVKTDYSAQYRDGDDIALLPEEVAEKILMALETERPAGYQIVDVAGVRHGRFGFSTAQSLLQVPDQPQAVSFRQPHTEINTHANLGRSDDGVAEIFRRLFKMPPDTDVAACEFGITPGWDSLQHVELLLALEKEYLITFSADEFESIRQFSTLQAVIAGKILPSSEVSTT